MIFFKKRSKKSTTKKVEAPLPPPQPIAPSLAPLPVSLPSPILPPIQFPLPTLALDFAVMPSPTIPKQQHAQKENSENLIRFAIPDNRCNSFDISHTHLEEQIVYTEVIGTTNTIDAVLATTPTTKHVTDPDTTHVDTANGNFPKEETLLPLSPSIIPDTTQNIPKDIEMKPCVTLNIAEKSDESENENAGVSLVDSEGEETRPVPDKIEFNSSITTIMEYTTQDIEPLVKESDCINHAEKNEKDDYGYIELPEPRMVEEKLTDLAEEATPFLGNNQLLLEQSDQKVTTDEQTTDPPPLPPNIPEEIVSKISKINEDDSSIEAITEDDIPEVIEQKSVDLPETINSLEVASHQQESNLTLDHDLSPPSLVEPPPTPTEELIQDNCIIYQQDVSTFEDEKKDDNKKNVAVVFACKKNNNKADAIVKIKSGHSLIPRKQYASSVVEENPAVTSSKLPVNNLTSEISSHNRRSSSGSSFKPVFQQQQNRLSLIISDNSANYNRIWGPSFDSPPKSPNSILSSTSTSSSGSSGTTTKEKRSSIKSVRLNTANNLQQSKIPIVTIATSSQISNYAPKFSPANISNLSRLPKRNSANL